MNRREHATAGFGVVLLLSGALAFGQQFEVEGQLAYSTHPDIPARTTMHRYRFTVRSSTSNCVISTETESGSMWWQSAFESGTIWSIARREGGPIPVALMMTATAPVEPGSNGFPRHMEESAASRGSDPVAAQVENRDVPRDDASNINYLWLAYGSADYLNRRPDSQLRPIWHLGVPQLMETNFTQAAAWRQLSTRGLPSFVTYFSDGLIRTKQRPSGPRYPAPFDQGFTNAIYRVLSTTNVGGMVIPTEFEFTRYGPQPIGMENGQEQWAMQVLTRTHASATQVRVSRAKPGWRPELPDAATVVDTRFKSTNPAVAQLVYQTTNGVWPESNTLQKLYTKEAALEAKLLAAQPGFLEKWLPRKAAHIIVVVVLSLSLLSLLLLVWCRQRSAQP